MEMSEETRARALAILQVPMTARAFAAEFWANDPEFAQRSPGSQALAGHALLRKFVAEGSVFRIDGRTPTQHQFIAANAPDAAMYASEAYEPEAPPLAPPPVEIGPDGTVVEVRRRPVGQLPQTPRANGAPPPVQIDPNTGEVVRMTREVIGRLAPGVQPQPQQPQAAPQAQSNLYEQGRLWAKVRGDEMYALFGAVLYAGPSSYAKYQELVAWIHRIRPEVGYWARVMGYPDPLAAMPYAPAPVPAPWSPTST